MRLIPEQGQHQAERDPFMETHKAGEAIAQAIAPALEQVPLKPDMAMTVLSDVVQQIVEGYLGEAGIDAMMPELKGALTRLRAASPAEQKDVLRR
jgi:hypothetical protein